MHHAAVVRDDKILSLFLEDCELLEEALKSPDHLRLKSAVVPCRRLLLEGVIDKVKDELGFHHKSQFVVTRGLLGLNFAEILGLQVAPAMQVAMIPDGLSPDSAPPGTMTATLTLDQFLAWRVAMVDGVGGTVHDVIHFLANKEGAVHYESKLEPDVQRLRDLNRAFKVMNVDALMSCVRGVIRVVLAALSPLRSEIRRRYPD